MWHRTTMLSLALALVLISTLTLFHRLHGRKSIARKESIAIVVLGDIGRSPRMMRHALSFADQQWYVSIFAYKGSKPPTSLLQNPNIQLVNLPEFPDRITSFLPRVLFALVIGPLKALYLSAGLLWTLLSNSNKFSYIMVQNPPAIPTLPIVQLVRLLLGSKLIIDWHNTAYSILALKFGSDRHPMVRLAKWTEAKFGKNATLHLFVTEAEKQALSEMWHLRGLKKVFYDRPPKSFCRLTVPEIHSFFRQSSFNYDSVLQKMFVQSGSSLHEESLLTYEDQEPKIIKMKSDRPALIVSSTSWTIDEDFTVLIEALAMYTRSKKKNEKGAESLPKLLCLITGKGPLKEYYLEIISKKSKEEGWEDVGIVCQSVWFDDPEDYRKILGAANLGISLHQSSSGLDLPMKVVDMFGCGLPVCARNFNCISELVKHGQNGLVFDSAVELSKQLEELLSGFNSEQGGNQLSSSTEYSPTLSSLQKGIKTVIYGNDSQSPDDKSATRSWSSWEDEWNQSVFQTFQTL
ncbi:hypothetical protein Pst134EA_030359 [Puccinia striiformis f. sp. tritici]|uniref:hypothetical protein n=2 Tax=Puccinia striiformis f. sp. tritici TaxID=168172 RepID=UPI002007A6DA|nr:hypothetical protein Pst134EA_030359 [Puccinia striiformis f. sp. tritici]KAH9446439.1 hypothetical protein Pst134EA_030359 [Puccinia striiformis f. sp. tritici]